MTPSARDAFRFLLCVLTAIVATPGRAEVAIRVADLRVGSGDGVPVLEAAVFGDKLYFRGSADGSSFDLWVYDGVQPPTVVPGGHGIDPASFAVWNGELHFRGVSGGDAELWRYDGASAPELARDLVVGASSDPGELTPFGDLLCFSGDTAQGRQFGCWDGVGSPQFYVTGVGDPDELVPFDGQLVFAASTTAGSVRRLFAFDGLSAPVQILSEPGYPQRPEELTAVDGALYFWAQAPDLAFHVWRWDGMTPPTTVGPPLGFPGAIVAFRDAPHIYVGQGQYGVWRIESEGLVRLTEGILPGGSDPRATALGDSAIYYLSATSVVQDVELYRFCGTESLPQVTDQFAGPSAWLVGGPTIPYAGRLYFAAHDGASGSELWSIPLPTMFCDGMGDGTTQAWSSTAP